MIIICKQCGEEKSSDNFSKRQLKNSKLNRKCIECVEKNKPPPQSERNRFIEEMRESIVFPIDMYIDQSDALMKMENLTSE